ncbi:MAG: hypothetical protein ABW168_24675 [Sedimenticola sp.]
MPSLKVFGQEQPENVQSVFNQGTGLSINALKYVASAPMDCFYWSDLIAPPYTPILGTSDASPCVIVVVHCENGKGALGHVGGTSKENNLLLTAATEMYQAISHPKPMNAVVLAGGGGVAGGGYREDVINQFRTYFGNNIVIDWPVLDSEEVNEAYTNAAYLPTAGLLALSNDYSISGWHTPLLSGSGYEY